MPLEVCDLVEEDGDDSTLEVSGGAALIINTVHFMPDSGLHNREGSQRDESIMSKILGKLGFDVKLLLDNTADDIMKEFRKIAENETNAEAFICIVLSHGTEGRFVGYDGKEVCIREVYSLFNNKAWEHRLKLFIMQPCRGERYDSGAELNEGEGCEPRNQVEVTEAVSVDEEQAKEACFLEDDIFAPLETLILYATPQGYVSYRSQHNGSNFIEAVRDELTRAWEQRVELTQSLTRVSHRIATQFKSHAKGEYNDKKQMPCLVSSLTRDVYLVKGKGYTQ